MSRTSETTDTNDLRCPCGRCLAKDGQIKCSRCDGFTDVRPRLLDEARHTAFFLSALAATSQILSGEGDGKPITVTMERRSGSLGYVQYVAGNDRFACTSESLQKRMVILLAGLAAERELGTVTTGSSGTIEQAMELARRLVSFGMADGWNTDPYGAARRLFDSAMEEATQFVSANRAAIDSVAAELLYKGELTSDDVARLTAGATTSAPGATANGAPQN